MRTSILYLATAVLAVSSCDLTSLSKEQGAIRIHFVEDSEFLTKAGAQIDTNTFILSVTDSKGASLYYGTFGSAPETIIAAAGTYTVSAKSCEFSTPLFDKPQYGDSQVVVVSSGKTCSVTLECVQINAGVRLKIDPTFLTEYPNGVFFLKSADGKLMYGYSEKRIAYFRPGNVSLVLNENSKDQTVCTRNLQAQEILTININVTSSKADAAAGIHIQVDTTRFWDSETIDLGGVSGDGRGQTKETAYSVGQAKDHVGDSDVWVYGYIVGGDLTSSKCSFEGPFSSRTNFVIATKSTCTDKESCISVQLPSGKIRDALNLVDHEDNLGRKIYLKGDIVASYYGIVGIQSISEYSF
ncbi:MAG: DUF4493 domain-containing protein [Bacteroidales bacterium]|nr:DUF4493 domain-containing protein [Bacteroidales bacterium]